MLEVRGSIPRARFFVNPCAFEQFVCPFGVYVLFLPKVEERISRCRMVVETRRNDDSGVFSPPIHILCFARLSLILNCQKSEMCFSFGMSRKKEALAFEQIGNVQIIFKMTAVYG